MFKKRSIALCALALIIMSVFTGAVTYAGEAPAFNPGDTMYIVTDIPNSNNFEVNAWFTLTNVECDENGVNDPEQDWYDLYGVRNDIDTVITFGLWIDKDGDTSTCGTSDTWIIEENLHVSDIKDMAISLGVIPAGSSIVVVSSYHMDESTENWAQSDTITFDIEITRTEVEPQPPVADAGSDQTAYVGDTVYFSGAGSNDPDGTIVSYEWDFGDGKSGTGSTPSHTYTSADTYTTTLTVTDNDGLTDSDITTVVVSTRPKQFYPVMNRPPVADAGPNQTVDVAQMVDFSGVNSTDPDGYLTSWTWDFGDGTEASGVNVSHRYLMGGNYTVTLTVVDVRLGEDTDTCTITVKEHVFPTPPLPLFFSNLIITPEKLEPGDNVTISVDIMNPNDGAISYLFEMQIEMPIGEQLNLLVDVELEAYESKKMSRTIFPYEVGIYNVTVEGMTGSFTVEAPEIPLKPAEFVVSDLSVTPEEVEPGDEVTISVLVTNIGEETGDYTVTLDCEDLPAGPYLRVQETVSLEGGESDRVEFEVSRDTEGTYALTVDGLTGSFIVEAPPEPEPPTPAEFVFSNLLITPGEEISPDEELTITISVDVTNIGETEGSYTVELVLDGSVVGSEEITPLEGGMTATVIFELTRGEGTYEVEVEDLTGSFTIDLEEEPPVGISPGYVAGIVIIVTSAGAVIYYIWKSKLFSPISPGSK